MYDEILEKMKAAASADRVYLTIHANRELKEDRLSLDDVICCIITGEIIEQQFDEGEEKYVLYGDARNGDEVGLIAKLGYHENVVVVTIFRLMITDYDF